MESKDHKHPPDINDSDQDEDNALVYVEPSFEDLNWPPESVHTYAQLYKQLVRRCGHEQAWGRVWRFLLYIFIPIFLLIALFASSSEARWYWLWNALVGYLLAALVTFVIFIAWIMNQDATTISAAELSARLIAATRSPRTGRQGLSALDLSRLNRMAASEQQAADWRGSVVTTVIFALVLTAFTFAVRVVTPEFVANIIAVGEGIASPLPGLLTRLTYLAIPTYVGLSLFHYFRRFASQEIANRTILQASADALAALEDCGLKAASNLGFREKRIVMKRLGFQLSPKALTYSWKRNFLSPHYVHRQNPANGWHIEPLNPKQQPYLVDILLVMLSLLPMMLIAFDNHMYGSFLRNRARIRHSTSEIMAADVQWPSHRKEK